MQGDSEGLPTGGQDDCTPHTPLALLGPRGWGREIPQAPLGVLAAWVGVLSGRSDGKGTGDIQGSLTVPRAYVRAWYAVGLQWRFLE